MLLFIIRLALTVTAAIDSQQQSPRLSEEDTVGIRSGGDVANHNSFQNENDCGNEECRMQIQILELTINRKNAEIKLLQQNNKEYILQSSSHLLVQAIQTRRLLSGIYFIIIK